MNKERVLFRVTVGEIQSFTEKAWWDLYELLTLLPQTESKREMNAGAQLAVSISFVLLSCPIG